MNFARRLQRRVLLVTDLSEGSMNSLDRAAYLCAQWECGLTILVTKGNQAPAFSDAERAATKYTVERRLSGWDAVPAIPIEYVAAYEPAAVAQVAAGLRPDLIVMAPPATSVLDSIFPTIPEEIAKEVRRPVLVAKLPGRSEYSSILAATDLASTSRNAALAASAMGLAKSSRITLFHAYQPLVATMMSSAGIDPKQIDTEAAAEERRVWNELEVFRLEAGVDRDCTTLVSKGNPAEALLDAAASLSADLITLGSRRRGAISRLLAGSTVAEVLRKGRCDVLIVPGDEI